MASSSSAAESSTPNTPVTRSASKGKAPHHASHQRTPRSTSAVKLSHSRLRLDSASPYRTNLPSNGFQEYFYSSSGALASAGRERDTGRDEHGNRWHAHRFPERVESLRDVTALVDLVDDRGGQYEKLNLTEETVQEHIKRAPKKIRSALQEYYDSQLEILEGWREADEILESSFPSEVLRRFGNEEDVGRFLAKSRYSQLHLNRFAFGDHSDGSESGYEEDEEEDEDEVDINARRGSIARAASAISGFWFNTNSNKPGRRKRESSLLSGDDLEEGGGLLGRDGPHGTPSRGRRGLSRFPAGTSYGATNFSSQVPSTTPISEHNEGGSKQFSAPSAAPAKAVDKNLDRDHRAGSPSEVPEDESVAAGHVDPHARKDSPSGRIVAVESEASAKGGTGHASEDGSLDRKLARAREQKEDDLKAREARVEATKQRDAAQAKVVVEQEHRKGRAPIIVDSTDDDDAETDGGIVLGSGPSTKEMNGYQPLSHEASSTTLRGSTNAGEADARLKGEPAAEGTSKVPAQAPASTSAGPTGPTSNPNGNGDASSKWPFRTAVDTLQERERRLLLETVPGKMEKTAELEKSTQFAININLAINILLIAGKGFAVITSNSVSLIASFVDSVLDLLSTVIIFITSVAIAYRSAHTIWKYPTGKRRLEPLGVVVFSVLMLTSFSQVLVESVQRLIKVVRTGESDGENPAELPTIGIVFMVITIAVKTVMWLLYRSSRSSGVRALAQDAQNDVVFNTASLLFPVIGSLLKAPALDPIGGIVLSLYIIKEWLETLGSTVTRLSGAVASKEHLARALYLVTRFRRVKAVSAFELYYSGDEVIAEADVVLPLNTPLKEAHDVCEVVTYCLEVLDIERAYVHLDYHIHNPAGHLTQRG